MAYAFVGSAVNTANGQSVTYSPTPGNLVGIFAFTSGGAGTPYITSVSDGQGGTWAGVIAAINSGAGQYFANGSRDTQGVYCASIPSGVTSITVNFNGGTPGNCDMALVEYSGLSTTSPLIVQGHNQQTNPPTTTDAITSNAINVTNQPALLLGIVCNTSAANALSAGTGFTQRANLAPNADVRLIVEDKRLTVTGNATVTATTSNGTDNIATMAMAFAEPPPPDTPMGRCFYVHP